jgi:predicted house-cleaning noncanonical NTP pyrophosphatase (MazG superfamily)
MKRQINKLVRDHIPQICENSGQTPETRILDDEDYTSALKAKLHEEVEEYLSDCNTEELADIIEVIEALAENQGSSLDEIMAIKHHKQEKNGAFRNKIFLMSIDY